MWILFGLSVVVTIRVVRRTSPLVRTAADLSAARRQGLEGGRYEHRRDSAYRFKCQGQDVSRVRRRRPAGTLQRVFTE